MATPRKPAPKPAPAVDAAPAEVVTAPVATAAAVDLAPTTDFVPRMELLQESTEKAISGAKDLQENFRKATEEGLAQTRAAYEKIKVVAEEATGSIESSFVTATRGFGEINLKALEVIKSQADASFEHMKALLATKSITEALSLHADHARKQFETVSGQVKELSELAQKVAVEAAEPLKSTFGKNLAA